MSATNPVKELHELAEKANAAIKDIKFEVISSDPFIGDQVLWKVRLSATILRGAAAPHTKVLEYSRVRKRDARNLLAEEMIAIVRRLPDGPAKLR